MNFKNVKRNKKVFTKCKSENITEADSAPRVVIGLKMQLFDKIVNDFKL